MINKFNNLFRILMEIYNRHFYFLQILFSQSTLQRTNNRLKIITELIFNYHLTDRAKKLHP